jgi:hypothetical protein
MFAAVAWPVESWRAILSASRLAASATENPFKRLFPPV